MRLLFDANISFKLVERLSDLFPDSSQVALEGLETAMDLAVWEWAIERDFVIVSKDEERPPPKVVWVRLGNCSTDDIERAIRDSHAAIQVFGDDPETSFLILRPKR